MLLVSGGFTFFTDRVCDLQPFDITRFNVLERQDDVLTGRMVDPPWGDICDGANDLPMKGEAGLSGASYAKPTVRAQGQICFAELGYTTGIGMRLRLWWAQNV